MYSTRLVQWRASFKADRLFGTFQSVSPPSPSETYVTYDMIGPALAWERRNRSVQSMARRWSFTLFLYKVHTQNVSELSELFFENFRGKKVLNWMFWIETNPISEFDWLFLNCEFPFRRSESHQKTDAILFLGAELVGPRFDPSKFFTSLPRTKNQPPHQAIARAWVKPKLDHKWRADHDGAIGLARFAATEWELTV